MKIAYAAPALLAAAVLLRAETPAASAALDGGALFRQRCQSCHSATPGQASPIAPNLAGIVGRKAAAGSFAYSPALKAAGLTWNRATLDQFLTAPMRMVPGTRMVMPVADPQQRAAIIDYLAHTGR